MTNLNLTAFPTGSSFRNGTQALQAPAPSQRVPDTADQGANEATGTGTGIANLVQLNLSLEKAVEYSLQISTRLAGHMLSIANDEPRDVLTLIR
jgi:hypothetical protein